MTERKNKEIKLPDSKTRIRITWTEKAGAFPIVVTAKAIGEDGNTIKGISIVRRKVKCPEELDIVIEQAASKIHSKLKPKRNTSEQRNIIKGLDDSSPWVKAFRQVQKTGAFDWRWGPTTIKKYLSYVERNILPYIQHSYSADDFTVDDRDALKNKLIEKSLNNGRSLKDINNANATADGWLFVGQIVVDEMRVVDPALADIVLHEKAGKKKRRQREQIKALDLDVHIRVRAECERLLPTDPQLARALMILEAGGARIAEAAAANRNDMREFGNNIIVAITSQEHNGQRSFLLKSDQGYRQVPLDLHASDFIRRANALIEDLKGEESDIDAPTSSSKLRQAAKKVLLECGLNEEYFDKARKSYGRYPEYDKKGNPVNDVVAYCLRRSRQNIWANICGLSRSEQDYLLGHKPPKKQSKFYDKDPKSFESIITKLERCRLIVGPDPSVNIVDICNESVEASLNELSTIVCNSSKSAITVCLSLDGNEPGDIIAIDTDGTIIQMNTIPSTYEPGKRRNTEII